MLTIVKTSPDGTTTYDVRPGHTVSGLMFYMDPFQAPHPIPLTRVGPWLARTSGRPK